ncbi:MAG: ABC-type transport auxiliary lipoprotein family protein [Dongiaceae bacterium]
MNRRMPRLCIAFLLLLAGCMAPSVPKEQFFRLIAVPATRPLDKPLNGVLEVPPFTTDGVLAERPLLFSANDGQKLEQRNYAYWSDSPRQMLRDELVSYLRSAKAAPQIVPSELRLDAKYVLKGTLYRLEQRANPNSAVIEIEFSLIEEDTNRLITSKVFRAEEPAATGDIDDAVKALNTGMNRIFQDVAAMIGQH